MEDTWAARRGKSRDSLLRAWVDVVQPGALASVSEQCLVWSLPLLSDVSSHVNQGLLLGLAS